MDEARATRRRRRRVSVRTASRGLARRTGAQRCDRAMNTPRFLHSSDATARSCAPRRRARTPPRRPPCSIARRGLRLSARMDPPLSAPPRPSVVTEALPSGTRTEALPSSSTGPSVFTKALPPSSPRPSVVTEAPPYLEVAVRGDHEVLGLEVAVRDVLRAEDSRRTVVGRLFRAVLTLTRRTRHHDSIATRSRLDPT